jgi:hypothetical protein
MPEFARVVTFDASSGDAIDALVNEINSADGPPEGIESTRIIVLADQARSKVTVAVRFPSEEAMKQGGAALGAMNPPEGLTRVSVDEYEVLLERTAS